MVKKQTNISVLMSWHSHVSFFKRIFIYLAVPGLSCACELLVAACGIQLPDQGSNPSLVHWEHGVPATGPPGKSLHASVIS